MRDGLRASKPGHIKHGIPRGHRNHSRAFVRQRESRKRGVHSKTYTIHHEHEARSNRRTFQCAIVGGPVTSPNSSSMVSLATLLRPWRRRSNSDSCDDIFEVAGRSRPMLPLSKLLWLLVGGVSGARGPGISLGLEDSVGRRHAGV